MSLQSDYDLLRFAPLQERATPAILKAARDIINESPATPNHANRLAWATSMSDANAAYAEVGRSIIWLVANPTISNAYFNSSTDPAERNIDAVTDNDLMFVVNTEVLPRRITPA